MNATHLHLIFTHLPIVGLGFALLVNFYALISKSHDILKLSLFLYVLLGAFAILAYTTGDPAEKIMENYPGIGENIIEPHENVALFFFLGLMMIAGASIIGLYLSKTKEKLLKPFNLYIFIAAILISLLAIKTASTGGAIRHTEIKTSLSNDSKSPR
jgi:predicted membrane channel-forming protein YqfA (hemolysin III family)